jgi:hypothetical protein
MPQEGAYVMVPDKITGAQTTDFGKYLGATKAGTGGAEYLLCYNANTDSVADGVAVVTTTGNNTWQPWAVASITGTGASSAAGWWSGNVSANAMGWVQVAGVKTFAGATLAATADALASRVVQTDTAGTYSLVGFSSAISLVSTSGVEHNLYYTYGKGPLGPKDIVLANSAATASGTITGLIHPRQFEAISLVTT